MGEVAESDDAERDENAEDWNTQPWQPGQDGGVGETQAPIASDELWEPHPPSRE